MKIESAQNPKIKNLLKLQQKSRERKNQGLFVVEGIQENRLALLSGFEAYEFYISDELFQSAFELNADKVYSLSSTLFEKIAYRGTSGGILGVYRIKNIPLQEVQPEKNALIVVLESIEKPGNLGAILRSCDAAAVDLLIVCDPLVDFYNPNVIRSSVGTLFTNSWLTAHKEDVFQWLKSNEIQIISTFLRDNTQSLYDVNFTKSSAIVLGTESSGLSDFWANNSDILIKIPMRGKVDSLNVSNAAAICIYEALRQKELPN